MSAAMSGAELARLAKLLAMLGSDQAGEVANAGAAADRFIRSRGWTWETFLALILAPSMAPPTSTYEPHYTRRTARERIEFCLRHAGECCGDRDRDFLINVERQLKRGGKLSKPQADWLEDIFTRVSGEA